MTETEQLKEDLFITQVRLADALEEIDRLRNLYINEIKAGNMIILRTEN